MLLRSHNILLPDVDFYVKIRIRFSLRDKGLFEIIEVKITRVKCMWIPGFICLKHRQLNKLNERSTC